ncbi:hypothetical protein [Roseimaritima ulvae]|uniref:hypothetical protein n=1 Tax=Roseimaritima ulvae TaxID=980254 RepID=UPI0008314D74|nr:hypothetical protein [Roseimaritima ulvae]
MKHPTTAGTEWQLDAMIFDADGPGIAIALFTRNRGTETAMGFRWLTDQTYFGKESEWILLPHEFSADAARRLATKKAAGMTGIHSSGFKKMMKWMKRQEDVIPGICY